MKIIAHRGASGYAPENTMAAFEKALAMGAEAVEFDVQMTRDGQLIVIHDDYLDRTSNGHGLVIKTDHSVIKNLDAGSWYDLAYENEGVPLLKDVLLLMKDQVEVHLEIKKISLEERPTEEAIYRLVKSLDMIDQVIFSSFDHRCLLKLSQMHHVRIGLLTGASLLNPATYVKDSGINVVSYNPSAEYVGPELVDAFHGDGRKVYAYTVNDVALAQHFETMGVDGIFSNYPDILDGKPGKWTESAI